MHMSLEGLLTCNAEPSLQHRTVLADAAVAHLVQDPDGLYVDGTVGHGGHAELIARGGLYARLAELQFRAA